MNLPRRQKACAFLTAVRPPTFVQTQNDATFVEFIRYCGLTEEHFVKNCSLLLFFVGYTLRLEKEQKRYRIWHISVKNFIIGMLVIELKIGVLNRFHTLACISLMF